MTNEEQREFNLKCAECGEECQEVEETFDYAGTHCTNGRAGTHHTGVYVSKCCLAEVIEDNEKTDCENCNDGF